MQGLNGERQGVDDRGNHQTLEGEGQKTQAQLLGELTDHAFWPHQNQQVEPENGGGQYQRQSNNCRNRLPYPMAAPGQPPGNRRSQYQKYGCGKTCEFQGEPDGLPVYIHGIGRVTSQCSVS